jgi:hypothetical protein
MEYSIASLRTERRASNGWIVDGPVGIVDWTGRIHLGPPVAKRQIDLGIARRLQYTTPLF